MPGLRIPVSTYRLQFNRDFSFADARTVIPYLDDLGITDMYASPILEARRGSPHGYDVINPAGLNPELGGGEAFTAMTRTLSMHGMGLLVDIVPNHMAASEQNPWWRDILQNGRCSPYAATFDIDWEPAGPGLHNKVLLPILGSPFGRALEEQELRLVLTEEGLWVRYFDRMLPLGPASSSRILTKWAEALAEVPGTDHRDVLRLKALLSPPGGEFTGSVAKQGCLPARQCWQYLYHLYRSVPGIKAFVDRELQRFNGRKGEPRSFDLMEQVLSEQAYRLAFWRVANEEINYRRFFDVSDLVSLRVEEESVFEATHSLILRLAEGGQVTGLRVDHIDGLHDPQAYLSSLQQRLAGGGGDPGFYVVVEKILGRDEDLLADWQTYGTTGYDFLNQVNGLFVQRQGIPVLDRLYTAGNGCEEEFEALVHRQKQRVMKELFAGELRSLTRHLARLAEYDRHALDLTLGSLKQALVAVTACLGVYRTYIRDFTVTDRDRGYLEQALAGAVSRCPGTARACDFLKRVLLLEFPDTFPSVQREDWLRFIMRWQQVSGPVMAKGYEDTSLYLYNRLVSLNEVAGEPGEPGISTEEFHHRNRIRQEHWPHTLNASSTHDTKRSEDVRARINVLSEIPADWSRRVERWSRWNHSKKTVCHDLPVPEFNTEYLLYQTLVGAWPLEEGEVPAFRERLQAYLIKAAREAKQYTSWIEPDPDYEKALEDFAAAILNPEEDNRFLADFLEFQKITARYGALNSLAQVLLKITSPGVPDFYQGMELWDFSLVDPDNRRPVDYEKRAKLLAGLKNETASGQIELVKRLLSSWENGRIKMYVTCMALHLRRSSRDLFNGGDYVPVEVCGERAEQVCSFTRRLGNSWILVAVPRLTAGCGVEGVQQVPGSVPAGRSILPAEGLWGNSNLILPGQAPEQWKNIFTGEVLQSIGVTANCPDKGRLLPLADLFRNFPVALLVPEP